MRVLFLGLRGLPNIQGGVETHCEELCRRLAENGFDVTVYGRSGYVSTGYWRGVRIIGHWAPKVVGLEAVLHTFFGALYAGITRPDVVHVHAVGPALFVPLLRVFGLKVVITHHGPDYDRQRWGTFARFILRLGERCGVRYSHQQIVISRTIQELLTSKYGVDPSLIPNGVTVRNGIPPGAVLNRFDVEERKYIVTVSRLVPEKRHLDLIEGFRKANLPDVKLLIIGGADINDSYADSVMKVEVENVVFTGRLDGRELIEAFSNAALFVLPSSHEGLPIALLEALSFGLPVVLSNIPPHMELNLGQRCYFELGDTDRLCEAIKYWYREDDGAKRNQRVNWVREKYDWDKIASEVTKVYQGLQI